MSINDLFVEPVTFEKVAQIKLSNDTNQWPLEIVQHLHEEHPYLADANSEVVLKQKDDLRGYGYGLLKIGQDGGVRVPIIVREWKMFPLDVWLDESGSARPLTEDSIKEATQGTSLGTPARGEVPGRLDASLYNRTYPPYDGKYVYASAKGGLPLEIQPRQYGSPLSCLPVPEDEKRAWIEGLPPEVLVGLKINGTSHVLTDFVKQASDAEAYADKIPVSGSPPPDAIVLEDMQDDEDPTAITKFGTFCCQGSSSNEVYEGTVFPHVYDFNLQRLPMAIFRGHHQEENDDDRPCSNGSRASCIQDQIAGVFKGAAPHVHDDCARQGDMGIFVEIRKEAAVALKPVKILVKSSSHEKHESTKHGTEGEINKKVEIDYRIERFHCEDPLTGEQFSVVQSPKVTEIQKVGSDVMLPASMKFCRLENSVALKSDPGQIKLAASGMAKIAMAAAGYDIVKLISDRGAVALQGDGVPSELWSGSSEEEALDWLALRCGNSDPVREKLASSIVRWTRDEDGRYKKDPVTIHIGIEKAAVPKEPTEQEEQAVARIRDLAGGLEKCAASLQDAGLVDTVLSLNFLTTENLNKFAEMTPQFEDAASHLADLLVASRVGLQIDEQPVKVAMENIAKVVQELKMLEGR